MDKLRAMRVFVHIVDAGSLTAASLRLGTSLASVVRQLAALERALGVRLLNRSTRRIALTDEGRDYVERCRRLLADIDEAERVLTDRERAPAGRIALTAPVMFGRLHVAPVVTGFLLAHEAMRAELVLLDRVVDLLEEGFDLAVRIGPLPESSLVAIALGHTQRVLCASPDYLARHGTPTRPADLAAGAGTHRVVAFSGLHGGGEWVFRRGGDTERVSVGERFATNHVHAAIDACAAGLGIVRVLAYQSAAAEADGRLVRLLPDWAPPPEPVNLVLPSVRLMSPRIRAFVDWAVPRLREVLTV